MNFATFVKAGDPDRYKSGMTAPDPIRQKLMVLYAFNLEIARAPWASDEPMIAEMRLQWWLDAIDDIFAGRGPRGHEVLAPLAKIIESHNLTKNTLCKMIEARQFDIYRKPHIDRKAFDAYVAATNGSLMDIAAQILGVAEGTAMRRVGFAAGVANIFRAAPELWARGREPLPPDIAEIASDALLCLNGKIPAIAMPAALSAWRSRNTLTTALKDPKTVKQSLLEESPARRQLSFLKCRITRRL